MSEQEVAMSANNEAIRPKAQMRQTSHKVVMKDNTGDAVNGMVAQEQKKKQMAGAVKTYCKVHERVDTKVHEHILTRRRDYMEPWLCSGAQEDDGCQTGNPAFQPGMAPKTWIC